MFKLICSILLQLRLNFYSQLFGEDDPDQDVSPDTEDPEAKVDGEHSVTETGDVKRTSTHQWAQDVNYDPSQLFNKFFKTDIEYLLKMGKNIFIISKNQ